jgi:hypothetical protein
MADALIKISQALREGHISDRPAVMTLMEVEHLLFERGLAL